MYMHVREACWQLAHISDVRGYGGGISAYKSMVCLDGLEGCAVCQIAVVEGAGTLVYYKNCAVIFLCAFVDVEFDKASREGLSVVRNG